MAPLPQKLGSRKVKDARSEEGNPDEAGTEEHVMLKVRLPTPARSAKATAAYNG